MSSASGSQTTSVATPCPSPPVDEHRTALTAPYYQQEIAEFHADTALTKNGLVSDSAPIDLHMMKQGPKPPLNDEGACAYKMDATQEQTTEPKSRLAVSGDKLDVSEASAQGFVTDRRGANDLHIPKRGGKDTVGDTTTKPLALTLGMASPSSRAETDTVGKRKRRASSESLDSSTKASPSESAADDISKDDDDDNDDDDDEKMSITPDIDPERLKSFNMFVRLFVDENLDRMVPISKQPKDKIQAILDACDRQFSEFHERSRKRVRTYLKSCRRLRRSKDNSWEQLRPTPPHLTSAAAEGLLAQACENESRNAKRMRMGLEPLPAAAMVASSTSPTVCPPRASPQRATPSPPQLLSAQHSPQLNSTQSTPASLAPSSQERPPVNSDFARQSQQAPPTPTAFRPPHELPSPFYANTNGIFRPGFTTTYPQNPAHQHPPAIQHTLASHIQNGPTDLSMKKSSSNSTSKNQLNATEMATIKQLIAGYRESAAFLYRSAEELEQLLLQQN